MDEMEQAEIAEAGTGPESRPWEVERSLAFHARGRTVHTEAALKGRKALYPHRLHLVDGRVLEGGLYREPGSRLSDDLYGMKGDFVCVLDAICSRSGPLASFMVVNLHHVILIEEL